MNDVSSRPCRPHVSWLPASLLLVATFALTGCDDHSSPTEPSPRALFLVRVCKGSDHAPDGELFRVLVNDRRVALETAALIGRGPVMILGGSLAEGNGGFNQPWSWHIDPDTVSLAEGAIEVCDGCASFIEGNLDYWLDTLGYYCPWSSEVISQVR